MLSRVCPCLGVREVKIKGEMLDYHQMPSAQVVNAPLPHAKMGGWKGIIIPLPQNNRFVL